MNLIAALLIIVALWCASTWLLQRQVIFPQPAAATEVPPMPNREIVWLGGEDRVEAWYFPPPDGLPPAAAVLFAHGNGEVIDQWAAQFQDLRGWGLAVLLVEYPGYGRSGGKPSRQRIGEIMIEARDHLAQRAEIDETRLIGYGRSLGGGAICDLAAQRELAALILESTFSSMAAMTRAWGIVGPLLRDPFDNLAVLQNLKKPVLILHGDEDKLIPVSHARALLRESARGELTTMSCGHNDCPRAWTRIARFFEDHQIIAAGS